VRRSLGVFFRSRLLLTRQVPTATAGSFSEVGRRPPRLAFPMCGFSAVRIIGTQQLVTEFNEKTKTASGGSSGRPGGHFSPCSVLLTSGPALSTVPSQQPIRQVRNRPRPHQQDVVVAIRRNSFAL
jgi:hypothetical protein